MLVKQTPRNVNLGNGRFAMFNKERDISVVDADNEIAAICVVQCNAVLHHLGEFCVVRALGSVAQFYADRENGNFKLEIPQNCFV